MYLQESEKRYNKAMIRSLNEKRGEKRFSREASINYTVMGDFIQPPGVITVSGRMLDISNTGMRFQIDDDPPKNGSILCIRIDVDFANAMVAVPVMVEIKWVEKASANKYYLGSRFMM